MFETIKKDLKQLKNAVPALAVYWALCMFVLKSFCPVVAFTGFPCPGCGCIRATKLILHGQFIDAMHMNPLIVLWGGFVLYAFVMRYVLGKKIYGWKGILISICLTMFVFYLVRMYLYFPNRAPYIFKEDNIFNHWIPGYSEMIKKIIYKS